MDYIVLECTRYGYVKIGRPKTDLKHLFSGQDWDNTSSAFSALYIAHVHGGTGAGIHRKTNGVSPCFPRDLRQIVVPQLPAEHLPTKRRSKLDP